MENRSHAIIAATFLVVLTAAATGMYFWFHHAPPEQRIYLIVTTQSVNGLDPRAAVKFRGITVGHVKHVGFDPDNPQQVIVRLGLQAKATVTHATYARLGLKGITGARYVVLDQSGDGDRSPLQTSANDPAHIPLKPSLLSRLSRAGDKDLDRINAILMNAEKIVGDDNRRHLANTIAQVDSASRQLAAIENDIRPAAAKLPKLVEQMQSLVASARAPIKKAPAVEQSVTQLSGAGQRLAEKLSDRTLIKVDQLVDHLQRTARHLDRLSAELAAKPQSVLFGPPQGQPGPGEPGFDRQQGGSDTP